VSAGARRKLKTVDWAIGLLLTVWSLHPPRCLPARDVCVCSRKAC